MLYSWGIKLGALVCYVNYDVIRQTNYPGKFCAIPQPLRSIPCWETNMPASVLTSRLTLNKLNLFQSWLYKIRVCIYIADVQGGISRISTSSYLKQLLNFDLWIKYTSFMVRVATDDSSWNSLTFPWHHYNFPWHNPSVFQQNPSSMRGIKLLHIFLAKNVVIWPLITQIW